jgi:dipeptidyl aminopeptidase/acylaminoacyl peptidase
VFERRDSAWVLWDEAEGAWLGMSDAYAFISEESGFRNIHVFDAATGVTRIVGGGRREIHDLWISPDGTFGFAGTGMRGPAERDLVRIDFVRGTLESLTSGGEWHVPVVSPRGDVVLTVSSATTRPPALELRRDGGRAAPVRLASAPSAAFASVAWPEPDFVDIASEGDTRVPARLYRPRGGARGGPGVVFVHGAGYLQNVHRGWSRYSREYGFHQLLAEAGYTVLDIDYRGSAGYGRDFRAAHKNRIGEADTLDAVAAARRLVAVEGCDARRIGIYGGSYGGFLTLMALFRHPGVFAAGAALRPVTDWHHYNEGYTANLLDDPIEHEAAWRKASPIWWADGLADRLLLCHGLRRRQRPRAGYDSSRAAPDRTAQVDVRGDALSARKPRIPRPGGVVRRVSPDPRSLRRDARPLSVDQRVDARRPCGHRPHLCPDP